MRYINDLQYLPDDEESRELSRLNPKKANVALMCAAPRSSAHYKKREILNGFTLRIIKTEEELSVDYGVKYSFW